MSRIVAVYAETSRGGLRPSCTVRAMHVNVSAMLVTALLAGLLQSSVAAQTQSNPGTSEAPQSAASRSAQADSGAFTLHVTTREVALEMIALDQHGGPVTDLSSTELRLSYSARGDDARGITTKPRPLLACRLSIPMRRLARMRTETRDLRSLPVAWSVPRSITRSHFGLDLAAGPAASIRFPSPPTAPAFASSTDTVTLSAKPWLRLNRPSRAPIPLKSC